MKKIKPKKLKTKKILDEKGKILDRLTEDYVIRKSDNSTKIISIISITCFLISLMVFSYGYSIIADELGTKDPKTFTISRSLGKGNKVGILIFLVIAYLYLNYLVYFRGPSRYLKLRFYLLFIAFGLLISLLWFTPWYDSTLHYSLATVIFVFILAFIILTYYLIYLNYQIDKNLFYFLIGLNIVFTIALGVLGVINHDANVDIFAGFELGFALLFGICILFLGFY